LARAVPDRLTTDDVELYAAHPFRERSRCAQRPFASHRGENSPRHELLDELLEPRT
jgi:hypothetical protein